MLPVTTVQSHPRPASVLYGRNGDDGLYILDAGYLTLTLPMLRLLSSKAQGFKDFGGLFILDAG